MIFKGSRYEHVDRYQIEDRGRIIQVLKLRLIPPTPAGFFHTFREGDRLDLLAYNFYRNPEKSWLIADANSEMDPADLIRTPGRQLAIPPDRT